LGFFLVLIKHDILKFIEEPPEGEFMAVIPVGYAAKIGEGPKKPPQRVKPVFSKRK
jgi:hypothetical protein